MDFVKVLDMLKNPSLYEDEINVINADIIANDNDIEKYYNTSSIRDIYCDDEYNSKLGRLLKIDKGLLSILKSKVRHKQSNIYLCTEYIMNKKRRTLENFTALASLIVVILLSIVLNYIIPGDSRKNVLIFAFCTPIAWVATSYILEAPLKFLIRVNKRDYKRIENIVDTFEECKKYKYSKTNQKDYLADIEESVMKMLKSCKLNTDSVEEAFREARRHYSTEHSSCIDKYASIFIETAKNIESTQSVKMANRLVDRILKVLSSLSVERIESNKHLIEADIQTIDRLMFLDGVVRNRK